MSRVWQWSSDEQRSSRLVSGARGSRSLAIWGESKEDSLAEGCRCWCWCWCWRSEVRALSCWNRMRTIDKSREPLVTARGGGGTAGIRVAYVLCSTLLCASWRTLKLAPYLHTQITASMEYGGRGTAGAARYGSRDMVCACVCVCVCVCERERARD